MRIEKSIARRFAGFALLIVLCVSSCRSSGTSNVHVSGPEGKIKAEFQVEYALSPAERTQGLMFRRDLGQEQGMFFIFETDNSSPFWMRNTLIPLDIIFIDSAQKILNIVAAAPQTDTPRMPIGPYRYVLEINQGVGEKLGIVPGDRVEFEAPR